MDVLQVAPFATQLVVDADAGLIDPADLLAWAKEWRAAQPERFGVCRCGKPALGAFCKVCRVCLEAEESDPAGPPGEGRG